MFDFLMLKNQFFLYELAVGYILITNDDNLVCWPLRVLQVLYVKPKEYPSNRLSLKGWLVIEIHTTQYKRYKKLIILYFLLGIYKIHVSVWKKIQYLTLNNNNNLLY